MSAAKLSFAGFLLVASFAFSEARAENWTQRTVFGAGTKLCAIWLADRKIDKADVDISWVNGYMAAAALIRGPSLIKADGLSEKDLSKQIDAVCDKHPNLSLREAAEAVAVEQGLILPPPD